MVGYFADGTRKGHTSFRVRVNRVNVQQKHKKIPSRIVLEGIIFILQTEIYYFSAIAACAAASLAIGTRKGEQLT